MIHQIFAFGSNFEQMNTALRSNYTFEYLKLSPVFNKISLNNYLLLNTCNRSEIYGIGNVTEIKETIFNSSDIVEDDQKHFFAYQGYKAVEHIFSVVCGLNSQIIGDNEISGQFKNSFMDAKKNASVNGLLEKMANICLQASKEIKTNTKLSNGTKSVSYAATKHILNLELGNNAKILVVGSGTIGKSVARNIKEYIPNANLAVCNRTNEKATLLANEINAAYFPFEKLSENIGDFEVVVSCISIKDKKLFNRNYNWAKTKVHLIDLSVPTSVDQDVYDLPQIIIENVDTISKELHSTFVKRTQAVPIAKKIMETHISEFINWSKVYENKNAIKEWQENFDNASYKCPFIKDLNDDAKRILKNKSTALLVEFIRKEAELNKNNIIENYRMDARHDSTTCTTADDCIKNKLNCLICSNSN